MHLVDSLNVVGEVIASLMYAPAVPEQSPSAVLNPYAFIPLAIPAMWAAYIYNRRRRSERAEWLHSVIRDVYFSERFDSIQQDLEHHYERGIDTLLERRINDRHVELSDDEVELLNSLDNLLNYIEHILGLEARKLITTTERKSIFSYWPNVVGEADRFSALRVYVALCDYTLICKELELSTDEYLTLYGSALPELAPPSQPDVLSKLEHVGEAHIYGRLYEVTSGTYRYPAIELDSSRDSRILHPNRRSRITTGSFTDDAAKKVRGELYRVVDPTVYQELDDWEGFDASNPEASPYIRRLVRLAEPRVDSWIYVGNHPLSERLSLSEVSDWRQVGDENGPPEQ